MRNRPLTGVLLLISVLFAVAAYSDELPPQQPHRKLSQEVEQQTVALIAESRRDAKAMKLADIGYPSPEAALSALRSKQGTSIAETKDWILIQDKGEDAWWAFTRPGNAAHPSAVKRTIGQRDGASALQMQIDCRASKAECDELTRTFTELNVRIWRRCGKNRPNYSFKVTRQPVTQLAMANWAPVHRAPQLDRWTPR